MSDTTSIQWTDATWNPVRGCSVVSPGCTHCYAMKQAHRFSGAGQAYEGLTKLTNGGPVWTGKVRLVPELLDWPLRWRGAKAAREEGRPSRVFVNSMSDLFHDDVPDEFIDRVFAVMALAPRHTFQVLTKRPERMRRYFVDDGGDPEYSLQERAYAIASIIGDFFDVASRRAIGEPLINRAHGLEPDDDGEGISGGQTLLPLHNVHLGVSIEDQPRADERVHELLATPAAVRFLSVEPMLGAVDLLASPAGDVLSECDECGSSQDPSCELCSGQPRIDWCIVGGESGPSARPCEVDWIRSVVAQCRAAKVPVFCKQMGSHVRGDRTGFAIERYQLKDGRWWVPPILQSDSIKLREYCGSLRSEAIGFRLFDRKGGNPSEWPEVLRVLEFPS